MRKYQMDFGAVLAAGSALLITTLVLVHLTVPVFLGWMAVGAIAGLLGVRLMVNS